ncbi:MAG: hypothetical protein L0K09_07895, partial [Corynebacterium casei]|uniref:hypothetical protein n=1 Tax=Corynebacterium casei TaxID=160386 RepID=UPI0026491D92
ALPRRLPSPPANPHASANAGIAKHCQSSPSTTSPDSPDSPENPATSPSRSLEARCWPGGRRR